MLIDNRNLPLCCEFVFVLENVNQIVRKNYAILICVIILPLISFIEFV